MKNRFLTSSCYQRAAGGLFLGSAFLVCASISAQDLLKNGNFESPLPVDDPTAGWAIVFPGGYDGDYGDWAIAGRSLAASRLTGGHGAHLRPNNWGNMHAYFRQVVTNLTPGGTYTLNILKMRSNFKYTDEGPPAIQKVYAAMVSGSSSNAVHGYSTNNGPHWLSIACGVSGQIEVQLHNWKRYMSNESAEDMKHAKCSAWFDDFSLTLTTNPPPAPIALAATAVTGNSFTANWSLSIGATGYRLDVSTNNLFSSFVSGYQDLDVGYVLTWNLSSLSAGPTYYYRVRAYNTVGTSGNSDTIGVPPPAPTALPATAVTSNSFTANWSGSVGAAGYQLDVSTDNLFNSFVSGYQDLDAGNTLAWNVSSLSAGTPYYYRVRAYSAGGTSDNSATISMTTPPAAPTALAATAVTSNSFTANWTNSIGATGYRLDVSTNDLFSNFVSGYEDLDAGNVLTWNVSSLSADTPYYYRVRAYNTGGTSGDSATISVTTLTP